MAGQGLFFRASTMFSNCRLLLNNRVTQINQVSGLKQKVVEKLKELKVPDKPKRPLSPYFKFIQEHRNSIVKKHPDWKVTDISKQCASDWKLLDNAAREKYERDFKSELELYAIQCEDYSQKLTNEQKEALKEYRKEVRDAKVRRKLKKKLRENHKPKKPMGAYMLYVMDQMKVQDKNYAQLLSELKTQWAEMPQEEKAKYLDQANKSKKQYEEDLKQWELKMIKEGNLDIVRNSTLAEKMLTKSKTE